MLQNIKRTGGTQSRLHARSKHHGRYDLAALAETHPALAEFVKPNPYGDDSVDFANPKAVRALNTALLKHHYGVEHWEIPENYLCPPIPGRADYIHHLADLLKGANFGTQPEGKRVRCLDIGAGANCIYPLIGHKEYGWSFVGSDIDPTAIEAANKIIAANTGLDKAIELRLQANPEHLFEGVVKADEKFDLVVCNPPFHSSAEEAESAAQRKTSNLNHKKVRKHVLNFGGQSTELWCEGGEKGFVLRMIEESKKLGEQIYWFSSLISKHTHTKAVYAALTAAKAAEVKTMHMGQGNKSSRVIAWTFQNGEPRKAWQKERWQ